ncbi:type II toxin-antitoxin system PemK/MazF family toxin [Microbacterium sp. JZ31]|uniref:type II toxin-antitoxin system PemK/MazF family toxin n=1 Tax=Microbacterium sp. JZ31 TaxID=1906274 RepID=UPI0019323F2E|nr:type II toxin-antitoxin system PemK/MazF family toxin [Microbacterium sp. JZ31]
MARGVLGTIAQLAVGALEAATRRPARRRDERRTSRVDSVPRVEVIPGAGSRASVETLEVRPEDVADLRLSYAPQRDGEPDAGEIVWTWVPYAENDGRGKDRPVLVLGRHSAQRVYAVKLTSRSRDGDREYLSIGAGAWDGAGRESWVDLDQLYSVHVDGMRREAAALDRGRFARVAAALQRRYGWTAEA